MSHEIRTPMNAVIGMTALLRDTPLTPEQRESVETIQSSGEHLLTVVNDILDFSKIEAGKLRIEEALFSLRDCVAAAIRLLATRAAERKSALRTEFDPACPDTIIGDVTRLRRILVNLLSGAVKFTDHGEVCVRVSSRTLAAGRCELSFRVQDTGIGIPADRLGLFFFRIFPKPRRPRRAITAAPDSGSLTEARSRLPLPRARVSIAYSPPAIRCASWSPRTIQ